MNTEDIKATAKNIGASAGKTADDVKKSVQASTDDVTDDAKGYAAQASDAASDLYGRAKETVRNAADSMPQSAADAVAAGKRAYDGSADQLVRQIAKQPLEALLLAGAIGYLVGWATSRS
ncbi:hypothetical protein [Beijerinckia sp. L45]|uniref:hypothetical protein n=1 Tax=Beijerinckia sp. L45 TaxID=1641855 RepID=UPI00131E0AA4|nr:hypothetical protein [Beijerinckia sp. L45]